MFRIRSAAFHKPELEKMGKICLPPSALSTLARLNIEYPMLFELTPGNDVVGEDGRPSRLSHSGVLEFTSDEGVCIAPYWLMQNLGFDEGDLVTIRNVSLPRGSFVKVAPSTMRFAQDISNPKAVLEMALRNFSCLTVGDVIPVHYNDQVYQLNIIEVKPATYAAISIIETDIEVDFAPALDDPEGNGMGEEAAKDVPHSTSVPVNSKRRKGSKGSKPSSTGSSPATSAATSTSFGGGKQGTGGAAPVTGYRLDGRPATAKQLGRTDEADAAAAAAAAAAPAMKTVIVAGALKTVPAVGPNGGDGDGDDDDDESSSEEAVAPPARRLGGDSSDDSSDDDDDSSSDGGGSNKFSAFSGQGYSLR